MKEIKKGCLYAVGAILALALCYGLLVFVVLAHNPAMTVRLP